MSTKSASIIKEFLKKYNVSQSDFARASGLCRTSICKYIKGANIHPIAAKKIEDGIAKKYRVLIPHEKLID